MTSLLPEFSTSPGSIWQRSKVGRRIWPGRLTDSSAVLDLLRSDNTWMVVRYVTLTPDDIEEGHGRADLRYAISRLRELNPHILVDGCNNIDVLARENMHYCCQIGVTKFFGVEPNDVVNSGISPTFGNNILLRTTECVSPGSLIWRDKDPETIKHYLGVVWDPVLATVWFFGTATRQEMLDGVAVHRDWRYSDRIQMPWEFTNPIDVFTGFSE